LNGDASHRIVALRSHRSAGAGFGDRVMRARDRGSPRRWAFKARFRRHAFGWKSQPAVQRVNEAVAEIKSVARRDPMLAAEGAVTLFERLSPALEHVDGSSGAIGGAVNRAIAELVPLVAGAPADSRTRDAWLERCWDAHGADEMPYIELLADYWGDLCASKDVASAWADRLIEITRMALSSDKSLRGHFHGTSACLSALYRAERYAELIELVKGDVIWPYKRWAVKALAAMGRNAEAVDYAESCRGPWTSDADVDGLCEEILLSAGHVEEAYRRYAARPHQGGTYLATFRAVAKRYPHKAPGEILNDLVSSTPGQEGKWFAAARSAGLHDEALALARRTPCDPRTLARAARDLADTEPAFAVEAGLLALHWLVEGHGYDITGADVWAAYSSTMRAAETAGVAEKTGERIKEMVARERPGGFVRQILARSPAR
jgi:hypothetical protein